MSSKVRGLAELFAALDHIPKALPRQVIMPALRVGARVLRDAIRAEVDRLDISDSGKAKLKRSIFIKPMRSRQNPEHVKIGIFFQTGQRLQDAAGKWRKEWDGAHWWLWLEYGTGGRQREVAREYDLKKVTRRAFVAANSEKTRRETTYTRLVAIKTMANTGRMPAQPFVYPAVQRAIPAAETAMLEELDRRWREAINEIAHGG